MVAGLTAGGIATMLAVALSLPLVSPHDGLFNSASVALAGLGVSLLAGAVWRLAGYIGGQPGGKARLLLFALLWLLLAFGLTGAALYIMAAGGLENYWAFTLVLAAVLFGVAGGGLVLLNRCAPRLPWWVAPLVIILALTLGWAWREQGDQPGGGLELPPPAARQGSPLCCGVFVLQRVQDERSDTPQHSGSRQMPLIPPAQLSGNV